MVEVQTTQQREMREAIDAARPPSGRAAHPGPRPACPSSTRSTRRSRSGWRTSYEPRGATMADRWREGIKTAAAELDAVNREVDGYCPAWNDPVWAERAVAAGRSAGRSIRDGPARARRPAARDLGRRPVDGGRAGVVRLPRPQAFPAGANLLIETPAEGRAAALAVLQASMFRLLTSLPPGAGPIHDRRSDRHRPQFRRVHASGRLRRRARHATRSGPTRARSTSGWPTWRPTWRR